jgi:hypothetical protein
MKQWKLKEKNDEKDFNGKRTPGSGSRWYSGGDVKTPTLLLEDKSTSKGSYAITLRRWEKIYTEALLSQRIPVVSIRFEKDGTELVVLSKMDFLNLTSEKK